MIKVVIADDQELIRESLKIVLGTHEDIQVVSIAADGLEVLDILKMESVDVILMDIRMPVMTGLEATVEIRKSEHPDKDIPIIAMTADAFSDDMKKCLDCGMNAHIAKPIEIDVVKNAILKFCNKNRKS